MANISGQQSCCPGLSLGHRLPHRSLGGGAVTPARVGARWLGGRLAGPRIAERRRAGRAPNLWLPRRWGLRAFRLRPARAPPAALIRSRRRWQVAALLRCGCPGETRTGVEPRRIPPSASSWESREWRRLRARVGCVETACRLGGSTHRGLHSELKGLGDPRVVATVKY